MTEHPAFTKAKSLPEPWRSHFPTSPAECSAWRPIIQIRALDGRVLAAARSHIECAWAAYIKDVPGINHEEEADSVLGRGTKLPEHLARLIFPDFKEVPYAK